MYKVTVSAKGQIALPAELRRRYGLKQGDKLILKETEESITLYPMGAHPLLELRGNYQEAEEPRLTEELLKERKAERKRER